MDNNEKKEKTVAEGSSFVKTVFDLAETCIVAAVIALVILFFIAKTGSVVGSSMEHTMMPDDRYILSSLFYTPKQGDIIVFAPGEEIVPKNDPDKLWVKRVIATEGQTVEIKEDGKVYVDNELLEENYLDRYAQYSDGKVNFNLIGNGENVLVYSGNVLLEKIKSGATYQGYKIEYKDGFIYVNEKKIATNIIKTTAKTNELTGKIENPTVVPKGEIFVMGDNRTVSKDSRYIGTVDIRKIVGKVIFRFWPLNSIGFVK